jgi:hypothetical protein
MCLLALLQVTELTAALRVKTEEAQAAEQAKTISQTVLQNAMNEVLAADEVPTRSFAIPSR